MPVTRRSKQERVILSYTVSWRQAGQPQNKKQNGLARRDVENLFSLTDTTLVLSSPKAPLEYFQ